MDKDNKEENESEETISLKKILFAAVLFILAMVADHLPALRPGSTLLANNELLAQAVPVVTMTLYLLSYLLSGLSVVKSAVYNLFHGNVFDEEFLMSVASIGAICLKQYPEAVAVMLLFQIGEYLEDIAVGKSKRSISELMDIRPDKADVVRNGTVACVKAEEVA